VDGDGLLCQLRKPVVPVVFATTWTVWTALPLHAYVLLEAPHTPRTLRASAVQAGESEIDRTD
jgi:hypothetical protein